MKIWGTLKIASDLEYFKNTEEIPVNPSKIKKLENSECVNPLFSIVMKIYILY